MPMDGDVLEREAEVLLVLLVLLVLVLVFEVRTEPVGRRSAIRHDAFFAVAFPVADFLARAGLAPRCAGTFVPDVVLDFEVGPVPGSGALPGLHVLGSLLRCFPTGDLRAVHLLVELPHHLLDHPTLALDHAFGEVEHVVHEVLEVVGDRRYHSVGPPVDAVGPAGGWRGATPSRHAR